MPTGVEKWSRDGRRVVEMVFAGISLDKARRIFERMTKRRPHQPATDAGVGAMAEGLTGFNCHAAQLFGCLSGQEGDCLIQLRPDFLARLSA